MSTQLLEESSGLLEAREDGTIRVVLISEGTGSSGDYPAETLQLAEQEGVFHKGLHAYMDHPTVTERAERPERSVMDLCGTYTTPGEYVEESARLEAGFRPYPSLRDAIMERIGDIGFSIRAEGEVSEADGRTITRISKVHSVDLVTRAGRGGKALVSESARDLLESTRREIAERNDLSYRPRHVRAEEATHNDIRRYLSDAVEAAHETEDGVMVFLQDYDDTHVYFRLTDYRGENRESAEYRQTYTISGVNVTLTGSPVEVKAETAYTPTQTGPDTVQESTATAGGTMVEINEAELSQLRESAERVETLEAELAEARAEATRSQATAIVAEAFQEIEAPKTRDRLVEAAVSAEAFDPEAFKKEAEESAAEFAAPGVRVKGFGESAPVEESTMTDEEYDQQVVSILEGR